MDEAIKKQALRLFTYGLYAVTTGTLDNVGIFTANWLGQVSFEPPLVAISVENDSYSLPLIQRTRRFAVNVLDAGQRELAGALGKPHSHVPQKAEGHALAAGHTGCPLLTEGLASVECAVEGQLAAGDSTIVLGRVVNAVVYREGEPLTMRAAGFKHAG
ncbi:MAG TPA: flavin reductase family protein [Ktedonobacterales bacterium]|nr:flavin reductase family protein [Ktedonobacterales bacterium]